jgi:hypothetical protein
MGVAALAASAAWADGAFPGSEAIFAPVDQPDRALLATNFGLVVTSDGAQSWRLICEMAELAPNAFIYQVGPATDHRLLAVSLNGLSYSDDDGCTWQMTDGGAKAFDVFPDPTNGLHLLIVGRVLLTDGGSLPDGIYESTTGGATFAATPLFQAPAGASMTGVEISAADPSTYYATFFIPPDSSADAGFRPFVASSQDLGGSWTVTELTGQVGPAEPRLLSVDTTDSTRIYLRLIDPTGRESFAIGTDGGAETIVALALQTGFEMSAFLRRADGSLVVSQAQVLSPAGPGGSFVSTDDGATFSDFLTAYHVYGMAERNGSLLFAADNTYDGFAVGELLSDGGVQTLLHYQDICGLVSCGDVPASCNTWFCDGSGLAQSEQQVLQIPDNVCGGQPCGFATDGGGGADGGTSTNSCGCSAPTGSLWLFAAALGAVVWTLRRREAHVPFKMNEG